VLAFGPLPSSCSFWQITALTLHGTLELLMRLTQSSDEETRELAVSDCTRVRQQKYYVFLSLICKSDKPP
jgi:hypothetical protein